MTPEPILDPGLPIVDPHHHLWFRDAAILDMIDAAPSLTVAALSGTFRRHARYLFDEFLADLTSGHNVRATVYIEVGAMYRPGGPANLQSVGEVEFANGMAAMAANGVMTGIHICAGIVGSVDLSIGEEAGDVLAAHIQAGGGRFRGVRGRHVPHDADPSVLGAFGGREHLLLDPDFRAGFAHLAPLGLSYDAWQHEHQLPDLVDLARAFPETQIIVDHLGGPVGVGPYAGTHDERFATWRGNIRDLAACPNVAMKLGGLGMPLAGLPSNRTDGTAGSEALAADWRPYIETAIEAFGAERCMFESNYPVDGATASYPVIWNAFKRIAAGASADEKTALFSGTAARLYRIEM